MQQAVLDGVTLEYEVRGSGEPVVLIHGALIAPTFKAMMEDAALDGFRIIRYSRQGHAGSSPAEGLLPVDKQADDCVALLRSLDAVPAHVVGHSGGGIIAIAVARRAPEAVRTLSLLEPALIDVPTGAHLMEKFPSFFQAYQSGDKTGAVNGFLTAVCGDAYKDALDAMPGSFEQAVADSDTFFAAEFPTFPMFSFTQEDAGRMTMPVLSVMGTRSDEVIGSTMYSEIHARVLDWFPNSRPFVLPGATHLLQFENPHDMAVGLASFLKEGSQ
jgi:pimeloyl-ACP methyl ester carboxylesterase